ncbi:hypothetical protein [Clostridium sp. LP20]|uniref:hypothetical protein n=1 Tax=Clostridium sp. LP20 TaxID=3418665 RepID=UPI003EE6D3F1
MRKKISYILIILLIFLIVGCNKSHEDGKVNFFEIQEATKVAMDYMKELSLGNNEEANKFASNKVIDQDQFSKLKENRINGYKLDEVAEGANFAYLNYLVIRDSARELRTDLDTIVVKVIKKDDNYLVDEVKAKSNKQVYEANGVLRIRDEESGKSEVLIRKKDLPREVYPKKENVVLNKETVPEGNFNKISISFGGNKIGVTTTDGSKTFIALAMVEESKPTAGSEANAEGASTEDIDKAIDDALEKPIIDKLTGYDLIEGSEIEKLIFSGDDGELMVQVREEGKGSSVRIYRNPTGELLKFQLMKLFPNDKYNVNIKRVNEKNVFIEVTGIGEEKEAEGEYKVDLKAMKVNKL